MFCMIENLNMNNRNLNFWKQIYFKICKHSCGFQSWHIWASLLIPQAFWVFVFVFFLEIFH